MAGRIITRFLFVLFIGLGLVTLGATAAGSPQGNDNGSGAKAKAGQSDSGKKKQNNAVADVHQAVDPSQYVGAETCKTCHEDVAKGYDKGPHWKTTLAKHQGPEWQGCEACHGPGKAHAESADPDKIIRLGALSREESSKRCLSCHEFGQEHANFLRSRAYQE